MKSDFLTALVIVAIGTAYIYRDDIRDTVHSAFATDEQVWLEPIPAMLLDANSVTVDVQLKHNLPKQDIWTIRSSVRTTLALFSTHEIERAEFAVAGDLRHRGYDPTIVTIKRR